MRIRMKNINEWMEHERHERWNDVVLDWMAAGLSPDEVEMKLNEPEFKDKFGNAYPVVDIRIVNVAGEVLYELEELEVDIADDEEDMYEYEVFDGDSSLE
ncbi:hypothetical protein ONS96_013435 [Cadophora gregata f. sp. sojae]|nr:hypothetical protein ONS96_013435 [Cadophora gregata f. sp. sojae]